MKLYKFRSLADFEDLNRIINIVKTGKFWCSRFSELNDPMEGVYITRKMGNMDIDNVYGEKNKYAICSFSGQSGFRNPIMWGYYANGFKGVGIEIEVADNNDDIPEVNYVPTSDIDYLNGEDRIKKVLTSKLECWKHEAEYRFLTQGNKGLHSIGEITGVCFGNPYGNVANKQMIYKNNQDILNHKYLVRQLTRNIPENIKCFFVEIKNGKVLKGRPLSKYLRSSSKRFLPRG